MFKTDMNNASDSVWLLRLHALLAFIVIYRK